MRLPRARGDDHRHRRPGRAARRARPDRLRPAQAERSSAGDLVVFSSKQIPGNEIAIGRIQNELAARGIEMITDRQAPVHVSGHPGRPELAAMYDWIRPEIIVPVHGEMRHMCEQARFALARGVPHGIVQKNGDVVRLAPNGPEKLGEERVGRLVLDGDVILPADGATMNERRRLATCRPDLGRGRAGRRRTASGARSRSACRACRSRRIATRSSTRPATAAAAAVAKSSGKRGEAARGGPPRRAPLRHRLDRQEAGGRRADRRGSDRCAGPRSSPSTSCSGRCACSSSCRSASARPRRRAREPSPAMPKARRTRFNFGRVALARDDRSARAVRRCSTPITSSAGSRSSDARLAATRAAAIPQPLDRLGERDVELAHVGGEQGDAERACRRGRRGRGAASPRNRGCSGSPGRGNRAPPRNGAGSRAPRPNSSSRTARRVKTPRSPLR